MQSWLRRLLVLLLGAMLLGLQYRLWIADGGVVDSRRLRDSTERMEAENAELRKRNATMDAEVADLRAGGPAIESHARWSLGMVRNGETFYLVVAPGTQ